MDKPRLNVWQSTIGHLCGSAQLQKVGNQVAEHYIKDGALNFAVVGETSGLSQSDPFGKILEHLWQQFGGKAVGAF